MIIINKLSKDGKELTENEMSSLIEPLLKNYHSDYWVIYSEESKEGVRDAIKKEHPERKATLLR